MNINQAVNDLPFFVPWLLLLLRFNTQPTAFETLDVRLMTARERCDEGCPMLLLLDHDKLLHISEG